jgi:hypothetical protein
MRSTSKCIDNCIQALGRKYVSATPVLIRTDTPRAAITLSALKPLRRRARVPHLFATYRNPVRAALLLPTLGAAPAEQSSARMRIAA